MREPSDPLEYAPITLDESDVQISADRKILVALDALAARNEAVEAPLRTTEEGMRCFHNVFPELVESNDVGNLDASSFETWQSGRNDIRIELDVAPPAVHEDTGLDVYIGGPATLMGAAIQAQGGDGGRVLYAHDGRRGASNWKGSASYFHVRDAIPVYYWPDNHGAYTLFVSLRHWMQRTLFPSMYSREVDTNANWNKLRIDYKSLLQQPSLLPLFVENQCHALRDVGVHVGGYRASPEKSTAHVTTDHAYLTHEILSHLQLPKPILMKSNDRSRALHLHLGSNDGLRAANRVFATLDEVAGHRVHHRRLSDDELRARGYDPSFVRQALEFTQDGYFPPDVDGTLEDAVRLGGGRTLHTMQLEKILVAPTGQDDYRVTRIQWRDTSSGESATTPVRTLHLSLGPSVRSMRVVGPSGAGPNIMEPMMWASGVSSVLLVKVDKSVVPPRALTKFRDHIDAHNKHIVRLAEREVVCGERSYQMFALQATGGGRFPTRSAHPESGLNVLRANVIPLLDLEAEGVEFDVISSRSCARGICGRNVFRLAAPATNMAMLYGAGGIGITMMAPNALLMKAIVGIRQEGDPADFARKMASSDFGRIPHWTHRNPFRRNYAPFADDADDPRVVARYMQPTWHRMLKDVSRRVVPRFASALRNFVR